HRSRTGAARSPRGRVPDDEDHRRRGIADDLVARPVRCDRDPDGEVARRDASVLGSVGAAMSGPNAPTTVIDHVIVGTRRLDDAMERFRRDYGLEPLLRSEHPQWGTRNAVVPVGFGQFIELLAIADPDAGTPLVEGLKRLLTRGDRMAGCCLRPPDLEAVAR